MPEEYSYNEPLKDYHGICVDCHKRFTLSNTHVRRFLMKNLPLPKRCIPCRQQKRRRNHKSEVKQEKIVCRICGRTYHVSGLTIKLCRENNLPIPDLCSECQVKEFLDRKGDKPK
jgi:hypothetical protein